MYDKRICVGLSVAVWTEVASVPFTIDCYGYQPTFGFCMIQPMDMQSFRLRLCVRHDNVWRPPPNSLRSKDGSGPQEDDLIVCLTSKPNMFPVWYVSRNVGATVLNDFLLSFSAVHAWRSESFRSVPYIVLQHLRDSRKMT